MIREVIDANKAFIETVAGIGTVLPFMRITKDGHETKTVFGDVDVDKINLVTIHYKAVTKMEDETTGAIVSPMKLKFSVYQSFVDSAKYHGSTQQKFDTLLDALIVAYDAEQTYVYNSQRFTIGDVKEFDTDFGDFGVVTFLGKPCHYCEFEIDSYLEE